MFIRVKFIVSKMKSTQMSIASRVNKLCYIQVIKYFTVMIINMVPEKQNKRDQFHKHNVERKKPETKI